MVLVHYVLVLHVVHTVTQYYRLQILHMKRNFVILYLLFLFVCCVALHTILQVKYVWIIFTGTCTGTGSLPGTVCTRVPV